MVTRILRSAVAAILLAGALCCAAQDKGYWQAASNNAASITGDIVISEAKLSINFSNFPIAHIRDLKREEASAAFGADLNEVGNGFLYRLHVPAEKRFVHKNTLCGSEDTEWMATYVSGRTLKVAFFSGKNLPVLTMDALANSTDLCGVFTFAR